MAELDPESSSIALPGVCGKLPGRAAHSAGTPSPGRQGRRALCPWLPQHLLGAWLHECPGMEAEGSHQESSMLTAQVGAGKLLLVMGLFAQGMKEAVNSYRSN